MDRKELELLEKMISRGDLDRLRSVERIEDRSEKPKFIWNFWTVLALIEIPLFIIGGVLSIFKCLFGWKF